MIKKLRVKFVIINMTLVTLVLAFLLIFITVSTRQGLSADSLAMMQRIGNQPEKHGEIRSGEPELNLPYFSIRETADGELETIGEYFDLTDEQVVRYLYDYTLQTDDEVGVIKDYNLRFMKFKTPEGENVVFADMTSENNAFDRVAKNSLVIGSISYVVFFIISILLSRWAVSPVEKAWNQQKQFVADASHDLKTPLTVILTNAEMLQDEGCTDENRIKLSSAIEKMGMQMKGLVTSMLDLARADNENTKTMFSMVDVSTITENSVMTFEPIFFEKGLAIDSKIEPNIKIKGNETELNNLLSILLDNAGKYCNENSTIVVQLEKHGNGFILKVLDEGKEISKEDTKNIFKRFYRADETRSLNHSYGLGLSIAQKIVENHNGKIWCESKNGINTFIVKI